MSKLPIVERLLAVESSRKFGRGTGDMDITTCWHRNPDGPEAATTITELVSALESASELVKWICERAAKIDHARYLESEGDTGKVNPEIDVLANAQFDGMLASYRDEFDTALSKARGDTK